MTLALLIAGPAAAVTTITTSGYAFFSNVRVANVVGVTVGPLAGSSGTASPGYDNSASVASLDTNVGLGTVAGVAAGLEVDTGLLTSRSTANGVNPGDTTTGTGRSQVNDLSLDLFTRLGVLPRVTTLKLTADTITSSTIVTLSGSSATLTGRSVFEDLDLRVLSLLNVDFGANVEFAPNTVLLDALGLRIVLNEQIVGGNGGSMQSLTTNAINIGFDNYLLGGRLLTGNIIVANSFAGIVVDPAVVVDPPVSGVPEPAVWLQMILGFGLAGLVVRRRQAAAPAIA
jgi:hypothetical protein